MVKYIILSMSVLIYLMELNLILSSCSGVCVLCCGLWLRMYVVSFVLVLVSLSSYNIVAVLWLKFVLHVMLFSVTNILYFYISTSQSMWTLLNMAVFCNFLMSFFQGMLLRYFLNDFEVVPVAPVITDITFFLHSSYTLL